LPFISSTSFSFLGPPWSSFAIHLLQSTAPKSLVPKVCERALCMYLCTIFHSFPDPQASRVCTLHSIGLLWVHSDPTRSFWLGRDFVSNSLWISRGALRNNSRSTLGNVGHH
jgi:hypothetical protein